MDRSNSRRARVWSVIATRKDGTETVECVKDEKIDFIAYGEQYITGDEDVTGLRVVEHWINVPAKSEIKAAELPEWRQDRYRVRVIAGDRYTLATSPLMSLEEAAQLACSFEISDEGYVDILPPTDDECQPDDEDEAATTAAEPAEQPQEAETVGAE